MYSFANANNLKVNWHNKMPSAFAHDKRNDEAIQTSVSHMSCDGYPPKSSLPLVVNRPFFKLNLQF